MTVLCFLLWFHPVTVRLGRHSPFCAGTASEILVSQTEKLLAKHSLPQFSIILGG